MENSFSNSETDPLLLLKERIIKTETLLEKYACLTRKFNDLEKSHFHAVENEKKAKKDAIKYLGKYCKLAKKSNGLLIKIKTLEDRINLKSNELKESQDEYAKLESVLQVYKTERKGHQYLKKDKDFLLGALWKVLKRLEKEPKEFQIKKITETFFKRFERELVDLKLEDFRCSNMKNISKVTEKEESEFLFSPGSQVLGSVESDFIDTDISPESVKSSFEEFDENCGLEEVKSKNSNQRVVDIESQNEMKTVEVNIVETQPMSLPDFSFGPFASKDFQEKIDLNHQEQHFLKDWTYMPASESNGFNLCHNKEKEDSLTNLTSFNVSTQGYCTPDTPMQNNLQDRSNSFQNYSNLKDRCFLMESNDNVREEKKMPEKFIKTYCSQKFKTSNQNDKIMRKIVFHKYQFTDKACGANAISDAINNIKSAGIDIFNVSNETISIDPDVSVEDIGSIPNHIQYCEKIYDFLTSSNDISQERTFHDEDSCLLFSTEDDLIDKPSEVNFDTKKPLIQKPSNTLSVFDVEDCESSTPSGFVCNEEMGNICLEFNPDSGNKMELREVVKVFEVNDEDGTIGHNEMSIKPENGNQVDENSQISKSSLEENNMICNSNQLVDGAINKNLSDSGYIQQEINISDEEVFNILKGFKNVALLSPLKEREPNKRHKPFALQSGKLDKFNVSQNIKAIRNLQKNMKSSEDMLNNKPNNKEEEPILDNLKIDKGREKKMVDKVTQTGSKIFLLLRKTEQENNGTSEKMVYSKTLMKKLCKMVWKKNLKRFKSLNNFMKMCKVHTTCFEFMKTLLEMNNHTELYLKNRTTENSHFMQKTGQSKSNLKREKRKMCSWRVEDVEVTNVISKNEPLFNCPKDEDYSSLTQVPVHYFCKDKLKDSTVKSEETQTLKNKMSFNSFTSDERVGFATPQTSTSEVFGHTCECGSCWECGIDSNITLQNHNSNDIVNDFEKRCESSTGARPDINKNVENRPECILENISEIDIIDLSSDALKTKADCSEKCVEIKGSELQFMEGCLETEKSVLLKRISPIHSPINLPMEEESRTNDRSLNPEESQNLIKADFFKASLPLINGRSTENHETSSNKNMDDIIAIEEESEESKSSSLKEKFEELFGNLESQSDCSSPESNKDLKISFAPREEQKQESWINVQVNENRCTADTTLIGKKRRVCFENRKASSTNHKKMKWDSLATIGDGDLEEKFAEDKVPLNDTYSSHDIRNDGGNNILDSIMTAMTKQTEFFKVQTTVKETEIKDASHQNIRSVPRCPQSKDFISSASVHRKISNEYRMKGDNSAFLNLPYYWNADNPSGNQTSKAKQGSNNSGGKYGEGAKIKSLVQKEIRSYLKLDINTVEEGEEKIKSCIAVLRKASENVIANVIVNEIMANVDEELKEFERPAPPLTQTQHRIMIILTIFSLSNDQFYSISSKILKIIDSKIFPENFFWPDDSLEMATRFYAALCKRLNNFKGIWKFCIKAITYMRQRWCIPIFVVLQVWPDIIHNANDVKNNLLVKTFVNVILHTPKSEHMRRKRQEQKLLALKHLLINFYNFDLNSTIEGFTQKVWESVVDNTPTSVDALVLISKCRNWSWTKKNVIAKLLETLESWMNGTASDITASKVLDIMQKITVIFPDANDTEASSAKEVISVLTKVLVNEKLNPIAEEKIIRILCSLCHYSDVRDILVGFLEKFSSSEPLHVDIQKALSFKDRKCKQGCRKANKNIVPMQKTKTKPKKKKKRNSSRQESVLDIK